MQKEKIKSVLEALEQAYKGIGPKLEFNTPYELLVAVILSAQCTDDRVNLITRKLFVQYNTPAAMVQLTQAEMEEWIRSAGFYHNKAKNILAMSQKLLDEYDGEVPQTIEELVKLPGVGRKTANVVASVAFDVPAIAVDTHVFRVANRIGLAKSQDVYKVETSLNRIIPKEKWAEAHHWLIWHGRMVCNARKPMCENCPVSEWCEYLKKNRK